MSAACGWRDCVQWVGGSLCFYCHWLYYQLSDLLTSDCTRDTMDVCVCVFQDIRVNICQNKSAASSVFQISDFNRSLISSGWEQTLATRTNHLIPCTNKPSVSWHLHFLTSDCDCVNSFLISTQQTHTHTYFFLFFFPFFFYSPKRSLEILRYAAFSVMSLLMDPSGLTHIPNS